MADPSTLPSDQLTVPSLFNGARSTGSDGYLRVQVRDQGPGLSATAREKVFTPFYTSKPAGLGLGLSMSRNIIEGFGGEMDIVENGPAGLTMECSLPLRQEPSGQQR